MAATDMNMTANAGAKVKTFGAFIAGGLGVAVIASGLTHGWDALTANGTNPFVDGGTAEQGTDTAPKVGLGVKPTDDAAFVPVTVTWVSAADASPAMPIPVPVAPPRAAEAASQPAAETVAIPSGWAADARQAAAKAGQPVRHNAAPLVGAPADVGRTGFPAVSKQPMVTPSKRADKPADVAGTGDWIGKLMPGQPAAVAYYTPTAAGATSHGTGDYWVDGRGKILHAANAADRQHFADGARLGMVRKASMEDVSGVVDVPEWRGTGKPNGYAIGTSTRGADHVLAGAALGYVKSLSVTDKLGWGDK